MSDMNTGAALEAVARAIWSIRREEEDRCDMELEDMGRSHPVWHEAGAVLAVLGMNTGVAAQQYERARESLPMELWQAAIDCDYEGFEHRVLAALPAQAVAPTAAEDGAWHWVIYETLAGERNWVPAQRKSNHWNSTNFSGIPLSEVTVGPAITLAAPVQDVAPSDTANGIAWQSSGLGITRTAVMVDGRSWYRDDDPRVKAALPAVAKDVAPSDASRALEVAAYLRLQHRNDTVNYDTMLDAADLLENMAANHRHPLFWYRPVGQDGGYEGPIHANSPAGKTLRDAKPGEWLGLYPAAQPAAQPADAQDSDPIRQLIELHGELLEGSDYVYFELARTRQTDWMAWLCSHPAETHPDRKVLAKGQGATPDDACRDALKDHAARVFARTQEGAAS